LSEKRQTSVTQNVILRFCLNSADTSDQWNSSQSLYYEKTWPLLQGMWKLLYLSWKSQNHFKNTIQYQWMYVATPQLPTHFHGV